MDEHQIIVPTKGLNDFLEQVRTFHEAHPDAAEVTPAAEHRIGEISIAVLDEAIRKPMDAPSLTVLLSPDTALKQLRHHPELTATDYRGIADLVRVGTPTFDEAYRSVMFIGRLAGTRHKAVVKRTEKKLYLTSFHRVRDADIGRTIRRAARGARWGPPSGESRQPHIALRSLKREACYGRGNRTVSRAPL